MRGLPFGLVLLAACGGGGEGVEVREKRVPPPPATASVGATRYVDRGVCPFECCVYRRWRATAAVPVYAREGDSSRVLYRLAPGERFAAHTGNVHLTPPGLAVALDTVTLGEADPAGALRLLPGDTVAILAPEGEGFYRLRAGGRVVEGPGFWEIPHTDPADPAGRLLRPPAWRWWAEVQRDGAGRGWIDMHAVRGSIWGADACSGPPPE